MNRHYHLWVCFVLFVLISPESMAQVLEKSTTNVAGASFQNSSDVGVSMSVGATGSLRVFTEDFRKKIGPALIELAQDLQDRLISDGV